MKRIWKTFKDFVVPFLKGFGSTTLKILTLLSVCIGIIGLTITLINPVNLWWSMSPIETRYFVIG